MPRPKYRTKLSPEEYQLYKQERKEIVNRFQPNSRELEGVKFKARMQSLRAKFGMNPKPGIFEMYKREGQE